ncbi:MAG: hypothetical protein KAI66_04925 [Lentisphaeria bacterium]|nr:hypothetical protein [Lentisphaeria bacterium]
MSSKDWPKEHQNALVLFLLIVLGAIAVYFFLLRPQAADVAKMQEDLEDLREEVNKSDWPNDASRLEKLLQEKKRKLDGTKTVPGMKDRSEQVLKLATDVLGQRVRNMVADGEEFMKNVTRIDYEIEFENLEEHLRENQHPVIIAEKVFGLSRDASHLDTYELLLQVWTVREIVDLLRESGLVIERGRGNGTKLPTPRGPALQASLLTVLPPVSYILSSEDRNPYITEFPVQFTVRGSIQQVCTFLRSLHTADRFLPCKRFELRAAPPQRGRTVDERDTLSSRHVTVKMVCSTFFRPMENAPEVRRKKKNMLPGGA